MTQRGRSARESEAWTVRYFLNSNMGNSTSKLDPTQPPFDKLTLFAEDDLGGRESWAAIFHTPRFVIWTAKLDEKTVVIKVPEQMEDVNLDDYLREVMCVRDLSHPNIVPVLGVVKTTTSLSKEPSLGYVMPYESEDLHDAIERHALTEVQILNVLHGVICGLASAHEHGIMHRDVKPRNILVGHDIEGLIGDFSEARYVEGDEATLDRGTAMFRDRRLAVREGTGKYGMEVDVYSFGKTIDWVIGHEGGVHLRAGGVTFLRKIQKQCLRTDSKKAAMGRPSAKEVSDQFEVFIASLAEPEPEKKAKKAKPPKKKRGKEEPSLADFLSSSFSIPALGEIHLDLDNTKGSKYRPKAALVTHLATDFTVKAVVGQRHVFKDDIITYLETHGMSTQGNKSALVSRLILLLGSGSGENAKAPTAGQLYAKFRKERWAETKAAYPDWEFGDIAKDLAKRWKREKAGILASARPSSGSGAGAGAEAGAGAGSKPSKKKQKTTATPTKNSKKK